MVQLPPYLVVTIIVSAWENLTSRKKKTLERKTRKQRQLLSEFGFVLCIALPSLSRDRTIKMKKSIKIGINNLYLFIMYKNLNLLV